MKYLLALFAGLTCTVPVLAQNLFQKGMQWLEKDHRVLPLPILYRSPETSWAAGGSLGYYFLTSDSSSISNMQFQGVYSLRQQLITRLSTEVFGPSNGYYAYGYMSYRRYFDRFYGIGPGSTLEQREDFSYRSWVTFGGWLWSIRPHLYGGLHFRHQHMYDLAYVRPGQLSEAKVAGSAGSTTTGLGPELLYDTRDNVQSPLRGWRLQAAWRWHPAWYIGTGAFSFAQLDLRHYHPIHFKTTWAKRVLYRQIDGMAPFRELAMAGGSDFARGYFEGRFRDNRLLGVENEWRWQIHRRFAWNFFFTAFQVGPSASKLFHAPWQYAYGSGWRFFVNPEERIALRIDVARTAEGQWAFYFDLSEAF